MSSVKPQIINNNNNFENKFLDRGIPNNPPKPTNSGYALSSWNYGSFHYSNPRYTKSEQPIKLIGAAQPQLTNQQKPDRPVTSQTLNKFGKRKLAENEKIVTEEYLKAMNDNKNIRGTSRKLNQNRSSSNMRYSSSNKNQKNEHRLNYSFNNKNYENDNSNSNYTNSNTNQNNLNNDNINSENNLNNNHNSKNNQHSQQSYNVSGHSRDQRNRSRYSSANKEREKEKIYKFGMTFEEWSENKNRQIQVIKNLNIIKEHELKEYEKIEGKIEENYKIIK